MRLKTSTITSTADPLIPHEESFADSDYWVALLNSRDQLHGKAIKVSAYLGEILLVTTEVVLTEVLNFYSHRGSVLRQLAAKMVSRLRADPRITIIPQSSTTFQLAVRLYESRSDKEWSLTDCSSILTMEEQGINDVLSSDRHFHQAGFNPLLAGAA